MPKPNYSTPPPLNRLNAIQRYMQKGELETQDYIWLAAFVLAYWLLRPYIQKVAKKLFGTEQIEEGEKAQMEYVQRRAAKINANTIRSGKKQEDAMIIDEINDDDAVVTSGSNIDNGTGVAVKRKTKVQFAPTVDKKTAEDELLDWDDEPARRATEDDKGDVVGWLNKWEKEDI